MKNRTWGLILLVLAIILLASASFYSVNMSQNALVMQFGKTVGVVKSPGLYLKWPVLQNVVYVDTRLQSYNTPPESFLTADKKPILLGFFAEWRVNNPVTFYSHLHDQTSAQSQIGNVIRAALRNRIAGLSQAALVTGKHQQITEPVMSEVLPRLQSLGVQLIDVRIRQVGLPPEVLQVVYKRMEAKQNQEANAFRSQGAADAAQIRASAEKEKTQILADAYRQQEELKGQGDAEAASIYGAAYGKDPQFFAFYRSLEAYRHTLADKTVLVLSPNSPFFKYFRHSLNEAAH
ncbi:MAG: protease modulator HflC [Acidithiobacillus sp.]